MKSQKQGCIGKTIMIIVVLMILYWLCSLPTSIRNPRTSKTEVADTPIIKAKTPTKVTQIIESTSIPTLSIGRSSDAFTAIVQTTESTNVSTPEVITITQVSFPTGADAYLNCISCAQQPGWRINLRSESGQGAGTVVDYLRHGDHVKIMDSKWIESEQQWWYLVEGDNEYEMEVRTVNGWVSANITTIDLPEAFPLGTAWVDILPWWEEDNGLVLWSKPGFINTNSGIRGVGMVKMGAPIEIIEAQWEKHSGYWDYKVIGTDMNTGEQIEGWLHGTLIVLTRP